MPNDNGQPSNPPGWQSNPSSWRERLPIVGLALLGFVIAGVAIALLAWIPRSQAHRFGGGWGSLLRPGREP